MFMVCSLFFLPRNPKMPPELEEAAPAGLKFAELRQLLGPPPVLRAESARSYDEIMARLMKCLEPRDFMEQILVRDLTDCTWEMARYTRHKTLAMERGFLQHFRYRAHEALSQRLAEQNSEAPLEPGHAQHDHLIGGVDAVALEVDHARALQGVIGYHERLDKLLITATARRNNVLEEIEHYRNGLGQPLRQISDTMIEAEFDVLGAQPKQVAASLVPSDTQ
jgi:hypothetical protein